GRVRRVLHRGRLFRPRGRAWGGAARPALGLRPRPPAHEVPMLALTILIDGITYAAWLFIVAVGLTLVFGVLRILNIAHGSFYALGAYAAASFVGWLVGADMPEWTTV